jgi:hypothetical protein
LGGFEDGEEGGAVEVVAGAEDDGVDCCGGCHILGSSFTAAMAAFC